MSDENKPIVGGDKTCELPEFAKPKTAMTPTPTPRTDAEAFKTDISGYNSNSGPVIVENVCADFARQLERELVTHKRRQNWLERKFLPCPDCRDKIKEGVCLRCENQRLERELADAKERLQIHEATELCTQCNKPWHPSWVESGWCILCILKDRTTDRDHWRKMCEEACSLIKKMDDDLKDNMPEYERLEGVTETLSRFNAMKAETK